MALNLIGYILGKCVKVNEWGSARAHRNTHMHMYAYILCIYVCILYICMYYNVLLSEWEGGNLIACGNELRKVRIKLNDKNWTWSWGSFEVPSFRSNAVIKCEIGVFSDVCSMNIKVGCSSSFYIRARNVAVIRLLTLNEFHVLLEEILDE